MFAVLLRAHPSVSMLPGDQVCLPSDVGVAVVLFADGIVPLPVQPGVPVNLAAPPSAAGHQYQG